jgi:hypothetical protein
MPETLVAAVATMGTNNPNNLRTAYLLVGKMRCCVAVLSHVRIAVCVSLDPTLLHWAMRAAKLVFGAPAEVSCAQVPWVIVNKEPRVV